MNLAYVAGFFDGEGCVGFARTRTSIYPRVLVVNTDLAVLKELQAKFGGDINPLVPKRADWKQGWIWRLSWSKAVSFLDKINKHLRIKQHQAETVFAWAAIAPGTGKRWDQPALALLRERMTWLNKKGPRTGPDPIEAYLPLSPEGPKDQP